MALASSIGWTAPLAAVQIREFRLRLCCGVDLAFSSNFVVIFSSWPSEIEKVRRIFPKFAFFRLIIAKQCIHIFNEEFANFRVQIEARQLVWPISNLGGRASGMAQKELKKEVAHLVTVTNWVPKRLPNCGDSFPSNDAMRFVEDGQRGNGQC